MLGGFIGDAVYDEGEFSPLAKAKFSNRFVVFGGMTPEVDKLQGVATFKSFFQPIDVVVCHAI